jgi:hypothetical protein
MGTMGLALRWGLESLPCANGKQWILPKTLQAAPARLRRLLL